MDTTPNRKKNNDYPVEYVSFPWTRPCMFFQCIRIHEKKKEKNEKKKAFVWFKETPGLL